MNKSIVEILDTEGHQAALSWSGFNSIDKVITARLYLKLMTIGYTHSVRYWASDRVWIYFRERERQ